MNCHGQIKKNTGPNHNIHTLKDQDLTLGTFKNEDIKERCMVLKYLPWAYRTSSTSNLKTTAKNITSKS